MQKKYSKKFAINALLFQTLNKVFHDETGYGNF